jgi:SARP family transcriptional regulator, regulator of embCAB operon
VTLAENDATVRFYLTGRVCVEGAVLVDQADLPGRQGRLALVYLVSQRDRPVPVDELAAAIWGDELPGSWETSLRALVSRLRGVLADAAPDMALVSDAGCYQARLGAVWVDTEAAANAVDRAEGAARAGDIGGAWSEATVGAGIARRPLLPGEELEWVATLRGRLRALRVRALDVLAGVYLARGDHSLAIAMSQELVGLEPYREAGYRHLMRAHLAAGDRGEAVRVHEQLRQLLAEELGVDPAPETTRVYEAALRER